MSFIYIFFTATLIHATNSFYHSSNCKKKKKMVVFATYSSVFVVVRLVGCLVDSNMHFIILVLIAKIYALRSAVVHKILRLIWNDNHSGIMQMLLLLQERHHHSSRHQLLWLNERMTDWLSDGLTWLTLHIVYNVATMDKCSWWWGWEWNFICDGYVFLMVGVTTNCLLVLLCNKLYFSYMFSILLREFSTLFLHSLGLCPWWRWWWYW